MQALKDIPIFFIIGRPRTGSTLLRTLFDAHPNVNIPMECQFIVDLHPRYGHIKNWKEEDISSFLKDLQAEMFFDAWTIDLNMLQRELFSVRKELDYARVCKTVIYHYQSFFEKKEILLLGDKNPGYTIYTGKLLKIFPEAKFIFINRDYRDNYLSLKRVDFELPFISMVTYKWKYFFREALKAKEKNPEKFYFINYEQLVESPRKEYAAICRFLDIEPHDEVFEFHKKAAEIKETYTEEIVNKYHSSLLKPINSKKVGLWKKELTEKQIRIADQVAGKYADFAGYERQNQKPTTSDNINSLPGVTAGKLLYTTTAIVNRFPYKIRQFILSKGPFLLGKIFGKG